MSLKPALGAACRVSASAAAGPCVGASCSLPRHSPPPLLSASKTSSSSRRRRGSRSSQAGAEGAVRAVETRQHSATANSSHHPLHSSFVHSLHRRTVLRHLSQSLLGLMAVGGGQLALPLASSARSKVSEVEEALEKAEWPQQFPFSADDFKRYDETPDSMFYSFPRFVTHIDDAAIAALTKHYAAALPPSNSEGVAVLDMCSSWISHYPKGYQQARIAGLGLNADELARNPVLTEYVVHDLNKDPKLPYEDNSFDAITNAVSVDYLSKPLEVFAEMQRVLKPGGLAIMSFSNRCFWTKAISIWTQTGDVDHVLIVGSYFHYTPGFERPKALDISPNPGRTDPMYVVYARKLEA